MRPGGLPSRTRRTRSRSAVGELFGVVEGHRDLAGDPGGRGRLDVLWWLGRGRGRRRTERGAREIGSPGLRSEDAARW